MISNIQILNKFDNTYNFVLQIQKNNQTYYEKEMSTGNLMDVTLLKPMFSYGRPEPKIIIHINKKHLNDWNTLYLRIKGIYVDINIRELASKKIMEI